MPLLNEDGSAAEKSEQIYYDVSPLELMFYTGDWKLWDRILPLIPEDKTEELLQIMYEAQKGGPDLVKMDTPPNHLYYKYVLNYNFKNLRGHQEFDNDGEPLQDDLLSNLNGIVCYQTSSELKFYYVDIDLKTNRRKTIPLVEPANISVEDQAMLNEFKLYIQNKIAMNSGVRTSDEQHAFISRIFGVNISRHGIHYELAGVRYQDTCDGYIRIKNAIRKVLDDGRINFLERTNGSIEMSLRHGMVNYIQRYCEQGPINFYRRTKFDLWLKNFSRSDIFIDKKNPQGCHVYPLKLNSGLGYEFGLIRDCTFNANPSDIFYNFYSLNRNLDAVRMFNKARKERFQYWIKIIEEKIDNTPNVVLSKLGG